MKKFLLIGLLLLCANQAEAGIFSKLGNWMQPAWNNYNYRQNCPCRPHHHNHGFYNNGSMTGFTPPIAPSPTYYPSIGNYHSPMPDRFDHLPQGQIPQMNVPTMQITDFNSNVGTRTGVTILD